MGTWSFAIGFGSGEEVDVKFEDSGNNSSFRSALRSCGKVSCAGGKKAHDGHFTGSSKSMLH